MKKKNHKTAAPRKGSLASFEAHFRAAMASAIRNGAEHPFAMALIAAGAATKAETKRASRASLPKAAPEAPKK